MTTTITAKLKTDLVVKNAAQLVTTCTDSHKVEAEPGGWNLTIIEDATIACYAGKIVALGPGKVVLPCLDPVRNCQVISVPGKTILPGFVDCHTHPVFAATRVNEFDMRIAGKTYQEIAQAGGGIRASVQSLRNASKDELIEKALTRLDWFIQHGTTTIEAKSGYGLNADAEIKMLQVTRELNAIHPIDLIPTFLGAHEIPDEFRFNREGYIELIEKDMLPRVKEGNLAEFCDVFTEENVFSIAEARRILTAGMKAGLKPKIHADQLTNSGGARLAAEIGAISADHLDYSDDDGMTRLREAGVVPVLLPGSVFFLHLNRYAPARKMIAAGLPVALATDFNPGSCPSFSMPLMMTLACVHMRLSPEEALVAVTHHSAMAIDRGGKLGILDVDLPADIVIWDVPNFKWIPYHFGANLVLYTIKKGKVVYARAGLN